MASKRKVIVYVAISADGYIARPDGDVEWLNRRPHKSDYGMRKFYSSIDTILLGRKTYDWAVNYYRKLGKPPEFDPKVPHFVFSRRRRKAAAGVEFVRTPVKAFMRTLRAAPGKNIWMMGGGELIASFLDAGEIDEFDIHVMPTLIGTGIPLIAPRHRDIELTLLQARKYPDGVVRLRYGVNQANRPTGQQANRPTGQQAIRPTGQQANRPTGQQAIGPAGQQANRPTGHRAIRPSGHQAIRSTSPITT